MERDVFYCVPGDMWTSANLTEMLLERFGEQKPVDEPEAVPPYAVTWQGRRQWYCPGCGVRLKDGFECGHCGKSLQDMWWTLVELHPHRGEW
jgi:hypothetical protein